MQIALTRWSSRIEREQPFCLNCVILSRYWGEKYCLLRRRRPVFRELIAIRCVLFLFLRSVTNGWGRDDTRDRKMGWIEFDGRYKKLDPITSWSAFYNQKGRRCSGLKQLLSLFLFWWRPLFEPCPAVVECAKPKWDGRLISTHTLCLRRRMTQRDSFATASQRSKLSRIGPTLQWLCGLLIARAIWLLFFWLPILTRIVRNEPG